LLPQRLLVGRQRHTNPDDVDIRLKRQQSLPDSLVRIRIIIGAVRYQNRNLANALIRPPSHLGLVHLRAESFEGRSEVCLAVGVRRSSKDALELLLVVVGVEVEHDVWGSVEVEEADADLVLSYAEPVDDVGVELHHGLPVLVVQVVDAPGSIGHEDQIRHLVTHIYGLRVDCITSNLTTQQQQQRQQRPTCCTRHVVTYSANVLLAYVIVSS